MKNHLVLRSENKKHALHLLRTIIWSCIMGFVSVNALAQDTTIVQTLTFDSTGRNYVFQFPEDNGKSYRKILMYYTMRCKDGLISTGADRNKGCGEWDYSCNTYITDSSYTDSIKASHANYIISGFSGSTYNYSTTPTYDYYQYTQKDVSYTDTTSESLGTVGTGGSNLTHPFGTSLPTSKTQYLILASELSSAGITAGNITGLNVNVTNSGGDVEYLRIKIKTSSQTSLSASNPETGLTEVYFRNTQLANGTNSLPFYSNFNWNGTSNIIIEISYTNPDNATDIELSGHNTGFTAGINTTNDGYFKADGSTYLDMGAYSTVYGANARTIELWSKVDLFNGAGIFQAGGTGSTGGDFSLRTNGSNNGWRAQLWGSGYDFDLTLASSLDNWHHYAMTYDGNTATVYYDGVLADNNTVNINTVTNNILLAYWNGSKLTGSIDELRVWNTDLSAATLSDWMYRKVDNSHPNYANLEANFHLDENLLAEFPASGVSGSVNGRALWGTWRGNDLFKDFTETTFRPDFTFVQGVYTTVVSNITVTDTVLKDGDRVIEYTTNGSDITVVDTTTGYSESYEYVYNAAGTKTDSFVVSFDGSLSISNLNYMAKYPSKYEIMSFVTPYGIGLDFGLEGKTWVFDVTDFSPILKGAKRMSMERGGQYQEEMDIKFLFIEGTPPRDVLDIRQIWRVESRNYTQIMNDDYFEPRNLPLNSAADKHKARVVVTGHGQEGEFIPRYHFIEAGNDRLDWQNWTECSENPIFPQGGTWIYDRAGWCPGAPSDEHALVFDGGSSTMNFDYGVTAGSGDSRYIVNAQLVSYSTANFTLDASVEEIHRPSNLAPYERINPACIEPIVVIKNTGETTLTSLDFSYKVSGGNPDTYTWTGSLETMESIEIVLPVSSGAFWVGDGSNVFEVTISAPNGGTDGYADNNTMHSEFNLPDFYEGPLVMETICNNRYNQNSYIIRNELGDTIRNRSFDSKSTHHDTLNLGEGCYYLEFYDTGDNGLDFWNDALQTTGYLIFKDMQDNALKVFENDFGGYINYAFVVGEFVNVQEPNNDPKVFVYPNPAQQLAYVNINMFQTTNVEIRLVDMLGKTVSETNKSNLYSETIPVSLKGLTPGVYQVIIQAKEFKTTKKLVIK